MRIAKLALIAFCLATFSFSVAAQSVVVTKRKVTYKRTKPIAAHKKSFVVNYPKVKAATPAISAKIEQQLSYFKLFEFTLKEEISDVQWLEEADFEVLHNANGILSVALTVNGSGAYPDGSTRHVVLDSQKGTKLTPAMLFTDLNGLVSLSDKELQAEIASAIKEIKADKDNSEIDPNDFFEGKQFEIESLNEFWVHKDGVVFQFDYGFPHAIEALQPPGEIQFTWTELKPFIKPGSLLATFIR